MIIPHFNNVEIYFCDDEVLEYFGINRLQSDFLFDADSDLAAYCRTPKEYSEIVDKFIEFNGDIFETYDWMKNNYKLIDND